MAIQVTVTSASGSQPLSAGVFVKEVVPSAVDVPCPPGPTAVCYVPGTAGRYQLEIGATGFQTVMKTVDVAARATPKCGCPSNEIVSLDVALVPLTL